MKKLFALLLAALLVLSMAACGGASETPGEQQTPAAQEAKVEFPGGKISGTIADGMPFSEGRAFVRLPDSNKIYCITKEGDIVFAVSGAFGGSDRIYDYPQTSDHALYPIPFQYTNGLAPLANSGGVPVAFVDMDGNLTTAEALGVSHFDVQALAGGYILAYVKVSDSEYKLGIMNTKFEWIVEATTELYQSCTAISDWLVNYYVDGFLYLENTLWLNLETGEIASKSNVKLPSYYWQWGNGKDYAGIGNETALSLEYLENFNNLYLTSGFRGGKAVAVFSNGSAGYSFCMINEYGRAASSQKSITIKKSVEAVGFDGNYILIADSKATMYGGGKTAKCYDASGNYCGSVTVPDSVKALRWSISEGIIGLRYNAVEGLDKEYRYYDVNGNQLFV